MGDIKGPIIILNGVSSSGKTTLARALQDHFAEPYFLIANDSFCDMCPGKFWDRDWVTAINQALTAMVYTTRTFSDIGLNTIVDQVFLNNDTEGQILETCIRVLHNYPVFFVRVDCCTAELERREKERGDRGIGQAVSQLPLVHTHHLYDCTVDTSANTQDENVLKIETALLNQAGDRAFQQLMHKLNQTGSIYP